MTGQPAALPPVAWSGLAAGPATVESLLALNGVAAGTLTGAELVDAVLCAEKAISRLVGVQARLPAALAVPFVAGDPTRLAATLARRSGLADDEQPPGSRGPLLTRRSRGPVRHIHDRGEHGVGGGLDPGELGQLSGPREAHRGY